MEENSKDKIKEIKYTYGYDNGFKVYKRFIKNSERKKESLTFKIHEIDGEKVLTHTFGEENIEYLNRNVKGFFEEFTLEDLKNFKEDLEIICMKLKIKPNYGEFLEELLDESNIKNPFLLFNSLFSSKLLESLIEEGFAYLIKKDTLISIKNIENILCENVEEKEIYKAWGMEKDVVNYFSENKVSLDGIIESREFIKESGIYDFRKIFLELGLRVEYIAKIKEFLDNDYEIDRFVDYIQELSRDEGLEKNSIIEFIADIKRISEELDWKFEPYMENIKNRHRIMVGEYVFKKEEDAEEKLKNQRGVSFKQVDYKYNCGFLRTLEDVYEEEKEWILNYIEKMDKEKLYIIRLSQKEEEKIFSIVILRNNKIIEMKKFYNEETRQDLNKYISHLEKRNGWKSYKRKTIV